MHNLKRLLEAISIDQDADLVAGALIDLTWFNNEVDRARRADAVTAAKLDRVATNQGESLTLLRDHLDQALREMRKELAASSKKQVT